MNLANATRRLPLRFGLVAVLSLAAALRLWRLGQNGFGNEYYSAGVRSMSLGWHNFFFNSFDPAGFISIDKPPVALWIQVASVKLFGFHALSVLVPQALEGVAAVALLYHLVQRRFGAGAGLLAALFLALTPVSVAIDRSSNTDSCLVLVLLLAAWALTLAVERGSLPFLALAMALVGLGFNVKMLAAFVVLPTFALVYLVGAPLAWRRRIADLAVAAVVLAAVSLSLGARLRSHAAGSPAVCAARATGIRCSSSSSARTAIGRFVRSAEWRSAAIATPAPALGRAAPQAADADRAPELGASPWPLPALRRGARGRASARRRPAGRSGRVASAAGRRWASGSARLPTAVACLRSASRGRA